MGLSHGVIGVRNYTRAPPLNDDVLKILEPIFKDLTSDDLLQLCFGNNVQNNIRSLYNYLPKHTCVGKIFLETTSYTAASVFHERFSSILKIMEVMGVKIGPVTFE